MTTGVAELGCTMRDLYLHGNCHIFAIAVSEMFGFQICCFLEPRLIEGSDGSSVCMDGLVHAYCVVDDDNELIFDALGVHSAHDLENEYHLHEDVHLEIYDNPRERLLKFDIDGTDTEAVNQAVAVAKTYITNYLLDEITPYLEGRKHEPSISRSIDTRIGYPACKWD